MIEALTFEGDSYPRFNAASAHTRAGNTVTKENYRAPVLDFVGSSSEGLERMLASVALRALFLALGLPPYRGCSELVLDARRSTMSQQKCNDFWSSGVVQWRVAHISLLADI